MIKAFYQEDIIARLAAIITYGINGGYSYESIEEHIISSPFINALEHNEYDIELKAEKAVEDAYGVSSLARADISFMGLFLAESYIKLFFYFNKSIEYLFLYWPLSLFVGRYSVYHEMDFSSLRRDFEKEMSETTLLKKLARARQLKLIEISRLTGINVNTIDKYSRDDKHLFGASIDNIYRLVNLFKVKENIFVPNIAVYLDQSVYLFDERNRDYRNYLGLYFANYFDSRIDEASFVYDRDNNRFMSDDGFKLVVVSGEVADLPLSALTNIVDSKTYLVIIPSGLLGDEPDFDYLKESPSFEALVLTQEFVYIVKRGRKKEITDTINRSLIILAKRKATLLRN